MLRHYTDDGLIPTNPVLVSDGGPDHRITYASVQVALLCLFVSLDLDMLVVARTCPYQSWQNIAERIMSALNLALMNVSLARKELSPTLEPLICSKKTMADVRQLIATNPLVGNSLQDAMQPVLCTLSNRLSSMEIKEEPVQVEAAASESDIASCFQIIHYIEPNLPRDNIKKETLTQSEHLRKFEPSLQLNCLPVSSEEVLRSYLLYWLEFPVGMPKEEFRNCLCSITIDC